MHADPWQLLIATILAAQSTDATINRVTPKLFGAYPSPAALAAAPPHDVEEIVKPTGFFRNKAKAIQAASRKLVEDFGGVVPRKLSDLTRLPGVARKTANVVLGVGYGINSGIVVDTHVTRVSKRLDLTTHSDPVKIEQDLQGLFPRKDWVQMSHRLVLFGRYLCVAKQPRCAECFLHDLCPSAGAAPDGKRWGPHADRWRAEMGERLAYLVKEPPAP